MLPVFLKYILGAKAAFFVYISRRLFLLCAIERVCFFHDFLLIGLARFSTAVSYLPPAWPFPSVAKDSMEMIIFLSRKLG